ncbi:MAG: thioredoxin domain-containing protein [Verrucomicrobiota bacterium]
MCSSSESAGNLLAREQSPYLLQHAENPVHWLPWGEAAFERARTENKPIFLSIGYSTCHWCHVMAHESFESQTIADILNEHFISIKVDREERPDVDRVYMSFVQATTGQGGWPLSAWLNPDLKPFAGGTYFPPEDKYGRPGFTSVLTNIAKAWEDEPEKIQAHGEKVFTALEEMSRKSSSLTDLNPAWLDHTYRKIRGSYDEELGGFGTAPKFPRPVNFHFLMRYAAGKELPVGEATQAREMVFHTLREMADGGMYDQIGGGFHRYSVDEFWHVPHFEKMLYDQAQLVSAYIEALQVSGDPHFAEVAEDVVTYVLRDLTAPEGGFYSAEDADSFASSEAKQSTEGAFYVWTAEELQALLAQEEYRAVELRYGVRTAGNVRAESDPHKELTGQNVLSVALRLSEVAEKLAQSEDQVAAWLKSARQNLFEKRELRPRPHLDDKVITAWNGMMISALARAGGVLARPDYIQAAVRAANFIREKLYDGEQRQLYRSYRTQRSEVKGFADDYVNLIAGLLDLYEATGQVSWLVWARELQGAMDERFRDAARGGYFGVAAGEESVLLRLKEDYDGAEPSPNAVAGENLIRLGDLLKADGYRERANEVLLAFADQLQDMGHAAPRMLAVLGWLQTPPSQLVFGGPRDAPELQSLRQVAWNHYDPFRVMAYGLSEADLPEPREIYQSLSLFARDRTQVAVCKNFACLEPVSDPEALREQLRLN